MGVYGWTSRRGLARPAAVLLVLALWGSLLPGTLAGGATPDFRPGAAGGGDPYFPKDGNGGYNVRRYILNVRYDPATDRLVGRAKLRGVARQDLSRFNLDFKGMDVASVRVNGRVARWRRDGGELVVTPARGLPDGERFVTVIRYSGRPRTIGDPFVESPGFMHTSDGAAVISQPHGNEHWFPVNGHPRDQARFTFRITVPDGLQAIANGALAGRRTNDGWTTWKWRADEPMASYLATLAIGSFDVDAYREDGIRYWDAIHNDLFAPVAQAQTGDRLLMALDGPPAYHRLTRTISVPGGGAQLTFWARMRTAPFNFLVVEARPVGTEEWTTLPDVNGHTARETGDCPFMLDVFPHLAHYLTLTEQGCTPSGSTGDWHAAGGAPAGTYAVDLTQYAGRDVEVSISYISGGGFPYDGAFLDDITVSPGQGSTSFEADNDELDGWVVAGPPEGTEQPDEARWQVIASADLPPPAGVVAKEAFAQQPAMTRFLSGRFGEYPFATSGGIVLGDPPFLAALETQTRSVYAELLFHDPLLPEAVVVHEMAHQWYGNSVTIDRWRDIWLNEGFATYAEWLWEQHQGRATPQQIFEQFAGIPADDFLWQIRIGNPGSEFAELFHPGVYIRGAMTLHRLRQVVGSRKFFRILRVWARSRAGENVRTGEFIRLAERIAGRQLDGLFERWVFTAGKPPMPQTRSASLRSASPAAEYVRTARLRAPSHRH